MLLAYDVGNTNISIAIFDDKEILEKWRIYTDRNKTADEYWLIVSQLLQKSEIKISQVSGIIISSVVISVLTRLKEMSVHRFHVEPIIVSSELNLGINIEYDNPKELGVDRIVNAVAGYSEYGGPLIIIDFGTATTFDAVSEDGNFLGGAIAPGINTCIEALSEKAPALPKIRFSSAQSVVGKNTASGLQSGYYFGFLGQMEEIIKRMKKEFSKEPKVIATGGLAGALAKDSDLVDIVDFDLTIKGLKIIYDKTIV